MSQTFISLLFLELTGLDGVLEEKTPKILLHVNQEIIKLN